MKQKLLIPSLMNSASYAAICMKIDECRTNLAGVEKEKEEINRSFRANQGSEARSAQAERVALLTGDTTDEAKAHLSRLPELSQKAEDWKAAIKVLESKLATERNVVSREICERVEPDYRRRVAAICSALIELNTKLADYAAITNELQSQDIAYVGYLRPMKPSFIERANDSNGAIASYLREAAEYKLIDRSMIPQELRR